MKLGFIGAGAVAQAIARHAVRHGHQALISNSRGPDTLKEVAEGLGPMVSAGSVKEAAAAETVFLAVPWWAVPDAVRGLPDFGGRVVVDTTNQFLSPPPPVKIADLGEQTGSEYVASLLSGAQVIKAFNSLFAQYIEADPRHAAGRQVLFFAGDDAESKQQFTDLTDQFGFAPVDLGTLRDGGRLMQLGGPLSGLHVLRQT